MPYTQPEMNILLIGSGTIFAEFSVVLKMIIWHLLL